MAIRLITTFAFLVVSYFWIAAKSIVLPELDFSKVPELEQIIDIVSAKGDSLVQGQKNFTINLKDFNNGYVHIGMAEGNKPVGLSNPRYPEYTGFYKTGSNIFFIIYSSDIDLITKTSRHKRFELGEIQGFDGVIEWTFYITEDFIYLVRFQSEW